MKIEIFGTGCPKCKMIEAKVSELAGSNGIVCDIEKVTDLKDIMTYGIMMTPGLVIGGDVKSSSQIPKDGEILSRLQEAQ